jgi:hypothetical protein
VKGPGSEFWVQSSKTYGVQIKGLGLRAQSFLELTRTKGLGFRVSGLGFRVWGLGFRV